MLVVIQKRNKYQHEGNCLKCQSLNPISFKFLGIISIFQSVKNKNILVKCHIRKEIDIGEAFLWEMCSRANIYLHAFSLHTRPCLKDIVNFHSSNIQKHGFLTKFNYSVLFLCKNNAVRTACFSFTQVFRKLNLG